MKAMRFVLAILTSAAVAAFYAVPSAPGRHHAATSRTGFSSTDRIASRTTTVRMSVSTGSQELPRLPPGDDSKGGDAQTVGSDSQLLWSVGKTICASFGAQLLESDINSHDA